MIDVDGIVPEVLVGPSHPGPQNALPPTSFQPQPPPRQQLALGEGKLSLIESINDDFESYLEQQQQKADMLRKKWLTCSMEEWEQGGSGNPCQVIAYGKRLTLIVNKKYLRSLVLS